MSVFGQLLMTHSQEHSRAPIGIRAARLFIIVALHTAIASASSTPVISQSNPTDRGIQMTIAAGSATLPATLYGGGFVAGIVAQWTSNGVTTWLQTSYVSDTKIVAQVPASLLADPGTAVLTARNPDGLTSNAWPVNVVARPVITQSNPSDGGVQVAIAAGSAALHVTLYGTGFGIGAVVQWTTNDGAVTSLQTTYVSATQIAAEVPDSLLADPGSAVLTIRNRDASTSNVWPVNVLAHSVITQSNPTDGGTQMTVAAGSAALSATLYGTGFATGVVMQWTASGGAVTSLSTTYVSATEVVAQVPASLLAAPATASLTLRNPDGSTSNAWVVNVVAHPVITQTNPTDGGVQMTIAVGSSAFPATVYGSGFASGSVVQWTTNGARPVSLQTSYVSATQLVAQVPASLVSAPGISGLTVRNVDGSTSKAWSVNVVARPVITQSNPTDGGVQMTIATGTAAFPVSLYGTGFSSGAAVLWTTSGGVTTSLLTTSVSATQVVAQVPAALLALAGTASFTVRNADNSTSNAWPVNVVARPVITQSDPTDGGVQITIAAGSAPSLVTLYGTGFATGTVVQWTPKGGGSRSLQTAYVSATQIVAQLPTVLLATPGTAGLTATNPDGSTSNAWPVNVVARPVITQSDPTDGGVRITVLAGTGAFAATLYGTGFANASVVQWITNDGAATSLSTTYVSATQIVAQLPASLLTAAGSAGLMVRNPDGSTSNVWPVIVAEPLPNLSSITPSSALVGSPALSITASGSGFYAGSVLYFNQTPIQTTVSGPSSATGLIPASLLSQAGSFGITVQNPGLPASNAQPFQVRNPAITGAVPPSIVAGNPAGFTLSLQGVFAASGCLVNWGAQPLLTTYSGTNLVAQVPPNLIATVSAANLTLTCGSAVSSPFPFRVLQPIVPVITAISPSTISIGGKSTIVKVLGRNLPSWSTVSQSCSNVKITNTTPVSAGELDLTLDTSSASSAQACDVIVNTPLAGASNPFQLTLVNQPTYTLNLAMNPPGGGAVSGSSQLTCSISGCTGTFLQGTTLTLTESPAPHAAFSGWAGDCAKAGSSSLAAITVSSNMSCSANFSLSPGTVMISAVSDLAGAGYGNVTASTAELDGTSLNCSSESTGYAACAGSFMPNANATFTASPSGTATFDYWSGCPSASPGTGCTFPITSAGTTIIEAFFKSASTCGDSCDPACPGYGPAGANCPSVAVQAVRSSASYAPGRIAPGQIVSIFGANLGPSTVTGLQQDPSGDITTTLAGTTVYFDGIPAPILATSRQQVNVIVPYQTFGQPTTTIQVEHDGNISAPLSVPLAEASPAIFTIDASGSGQGAVVNQDGTINSASQPAPRGSIVSFYGTGAGIYSAQLRSGQVVGATLPSPLLSVEAFVGGVPVQVQYAGGSPGEVTGLLQVNVRLPSDISSGAAVPIQLRVGGIFTQPGVTIAIQ